MGDAVLLTVEVWAVHLVEEQVELRRLGLHRGAAVQSHAHLGENLSLRTLSRKKIYVPVKHRPLAVVVDTETVSGHFLASTFFGSMRSLLL